MKNIKNVIGLVLLLPPLLSVFLFIINLLVRDSGNIIRLHNLSAEWSGNYSDLGGGYMSSTPIYFGLMAIAGAFLLKDECKKE